MCFKYLKKTLKMKVMTILLVVHLGAIPLKRKLAIIHQNKKWSIWPNDRSIPKILKVYLHIYMYLCK